MLHLLTVIGARPQIIKASALNRAIETTYANQIRQTLLHTGQHYDESMSAVFFREMGIPEPHYDLRIGSASHGHQTASMLQGIEDVLVKERPDALIVYGDTNSTLAGAVAASKLGVPVAHIEAGLRSFNKSMPEEINRILCDHVSTFLFTPTQSGWKNLEGESLTRYTPQILKGGLQPDIDHPLVMHTGDVMLDNSLFFAETAEQQSGILEQHHLKPNHFFLATIHRNANTDDPVRLECLFESLLSLIKIHEIPVVLPLHPRTRKMLDSNISLLEKIQTEPGFLLLPPTSFFEMLLLQRNARIILTDSGGVQKEAYFFNRPCIILRPETEWVELVEQGAAHIVDANREQIHESVEYFMHHKPNFVPIFGNGHSAEQICDVLLRFL
jgi:UDP-GlcNAc3NAcA epimerase